MAVAMNDNPVRQTKAGGAQMIAPPAFRSLAQ